MPHLPDAVGAVPRFGSHHHPESIQRRLVNPQDGAEIRRPRSTNRRQNLCKVRVAKRANAGLNASTLFALRTDTLGKDAPLNIRLNIVFSRDLQYESLARTARRRLQCTDSERVFPSRSGALYISRTSKPVQKKHET